MELMNQYHHLPAQFERFGSLYGKSGFVPLIANTKEGKLLVGTCKWSNEPMTTKEFEELLHDIEQTAKKPIIITFFQKKDLRMNCLLWLKIWIIYSVLIWRRCRCIEKQQGL